MLCEKAFDKLVKLRENLSDPLLFDGPVVVHFAVQADHDVPFRVTRIHPDATDVAVEHDDQEVARDLIGRALPVTVDGHHLASAAGQANANLVLQEVPQFNIWLYG